MIKTIRIAVACALVLCSGLRSAYAAQWDTPHVSPAQHTLKCERPMRLKETQTREEIAARLGIKLGIIGHIQRLSEEMDRMRGVGYRGDHTLTLDRPVRLVYTRGIEFAAAANDTGVKFQARRIGWRMVVENDDPVRKHLKKETIDGLKGAVNEWIERQHRDTENLRNRLARAYPWDAAEKQALKTRKSDTFVQNAGFKFCGQEYPILIRAHWVR